MTTTAEESIVKHIGVREFRDRASGYLREAEPLAVERHGKVIGFYIPVEPKEPEREEMLRESLHRLESTLSRALEESGMTEDELAEYFDLSKPPPDTVSEARERAAGRYGERSNGS